MSRGVTASILAVLVVLPMVAVYAAKPGWVDVGKYAEYEIYAEGNMLNVSGKIGSVRIEIKFVSDSYATVEVSANINLQALSPLRDEFRGGLPPMPIPVPIPVPEDPSYTYFDAFVWWYREDMPPWFSLPLVLGSRSLENLSRGQIPRLLSLQAPFSVSSESKRVAAGGFDCYKLSTSTSFPSFSVSINLWYEKSTGLLIAYEYYWQFQGKGAHIYMQLKSTNVFGGASVPLTTNIVGGLAVPQTTMIAMVVVIAAAATGAALMLRRSKRATTL